MMIVEHVYERLPSTDKRNLCRWCLLPVGDGIHGSALADDRDQAATQTIGPERTTP